MTSTGSAQHHQRPTPPMATPSPSSNPHTRRHPRSRQRGTHEGKPPPNETQNATPESVRGDPLALRPSTVPAVSASGFGRSTPPDGQRSIQQRSNQDRRGSKRGHDHRQASNAVNREVAGSTRTFGGNLTKEADVAAPHPEPASGARLRAGAPVFTPGQTPSNGSVQKHSQPQKRRLSKSTAADLKTRLHEDIDNRQYECAICTADIVRTSRIWSCATCWTVFHLSCIKQWANNSEADALAQAQRTGDTSATRQWRCPGCNLPQDQKPSVYTCWCRKEHDPRPVTGLPPHSCGQTCGKDRKVPRACPHRCELLCHAGPCPPCSATGPRQSCFCGKETSQKRCLDTDYENGWSCGQICSDIMPCGEHVCQRKCHEGLCGGCEVRIESRCMCGTEHKQLLCCDRDSDQLTRRSHLSGQDEHLDEEWTGRFYCGNECGRLFACGNHACRKPCHPTTELNIPCPRSPELVTHCPCGKTVLPELLDKPRTACEDKIPNCTKQCLKTLPCGHACRQTCHLGECMPCLQTVEIQCRCKRVTATTICHQGLPEPPQCTRICHTTLNCGRHECGERCCPGERKSIERNVSKKKGRSLGSAHQQRAEDFEAEHICTRMCGRMLKCGQHMCQELCHRGPCGSCREAIFDEVSCNCGRTILQPPLPCGTKPPPCRYDCQRPKSCGHPQVKHNCHTDDDSCPSCPFLVEKRCICGKSSLKNQKCWFSDVRCGQICGKQLKCGLHTCRKTCHRPGDCEDVGGKCAQPCGRLKKVCGHPCEDQCHAPYPCKQDKSCPHKLLITCLCQAHKEEVRCGASATSDGNLKRELKCDDECARLERNRKLAVALDIDPSTHTDDHVPYSTETLKMFSEKPTWCTEHEREFRVFAADSGERRLRFKPMANHHRAFLHTLAEDYGLDSESMDPEPHRHVAIFKTPRFVGAPMKTLRDALRIRQAQLREEGREVIANAQAKANAEAKARAAAREPYNGYLLRQPRFALTSDEIHAALASAQMNATTATTGPDSNLEFSIQFLPSEDIAIVASFHLQPKDGIDRLLERSLADAKPSYSRGIISQHKLATSLHLARFDDSLNVVRREDLSTEVGGWSQVVAKAAAPRRAPVISGLGEKSGFAVLQASGGASGSAKSRAREKKDRKKERKGSVADDWEAELEKEEAELEKVILGEKREALESSDEAPSDLRNGQKGAADVDSERNQLLQSARDDSGAVEIEDQAAM